jgi:hypothetical protein
LHCLLLFPRPSSTLNVFFKLHHLLRLWMLRKCCRAGAMERWGG